MSRLLASTIALVVTGFSAALAAQDPPPGGEDQRRALIAQAEAAQSAGQHDRALALASEAGELRWTPSLRMLVAQEHLALQHGIDALDHATYCLVTAEADPAVRNRARIIAACRTIIELLEAQVGHLLLALPDELPAGLHIRLNGRDVPRSMWETALAVMPGRAVLELDGEGVSALRTEVDVFARAQSELRVNFNEPPPPPPSSVAPPDAGARPTSARPSSPR